jgi:signal transduction histidine kinase
MELKEQYRAVQAAQILERKANDSKRQFVSYIFHEVRVPLNTATLATQNLEGEGVFASDRLSTDHRDMIDGLIGSLDMMEKVLNDVLSFGRMEAGNLEQARKPFAFHKAINIVALLHRVHAAHANLDFDVELDPQIDEVGGLVVGDEMRLRQVTSNLISNALKFVSNVGRVGCADDGRLARGVSPCGPSWCAQKTTTATCTLTRQTAAW